MKKIIVVTKITEIVLYELKKTQISIALFQSKQRIKGSFEIFRFYQMFLWDPQGTPDLPFLRDTKLMEIELSKYLDVSLNLWKLII